MENKVKFNRFERYIPFPKQDGILRVNTTEDGMNYKSIDELNVEYGRENLMCGFKPSFEGTTLKISKGQLLAHSKLAYNFRILNTEMATLNLYSKISGVKGKHVFSESSHLIYTDKHYDEQSYGGADYSESEYLRPNMTSENYPYGVCWADNVNADVDSNGNQIFLPWKAFNGTVSDSNDAYISVNPTTGLLPCCLYYSVSDTNDKWVKPTCFTITNRNMADKIRPMATFLIQGSQILHPYDDLDWETLVNVDGTNLTYPATNAGVGTYYVDTDKYYRHFRIKCLTINTTVPSGNNMFAIGDWNIKGYTNDVMPILNPVKKYFLLYVHQIDTDEYKEMFIVSKTDLPVLDDNLEIVDYYPIQASYMDINDYKNAIFIDKKEDDEIDITNYLEPNTQYKVYVIANNTNDFTYKVIKSNSIATGGPRKLICTYKVDENGNVVKYYPRNDVVNSYNDRFLIQEQIGSIGYRIYSDGWKEQWGNNANPVFPIAFEEMPVIVERGATNVTRTGMTIEAGYWSVKGY